MTKTKGERKKLRKKRKHGYKFPGAPKGIGAAARKRIIIQMLMGMQDKKCYYCGRQCVLVSVVERKVHHLSATVDHIIPVSQGGESTLQNLLLACSECNGKRGGSWKHPITKQPITFPLDFGKRWDFLKEVK